MFTNKPTVLIVDDTTANLQLLAAILGEEYIVKIANNGIRAIEIAKESDFIDLILLDIMMPELDGYEVCKILKNNPKTSEIPIIFVTAKDEVSDQIKGFNLGAVDYIVKPFEVVLVKARANTHINLRRKTQILEQLAMIDGLTEIPNRRRFDEFYKNDCARALRREEQIGLLMIDIDYFKGYNDGYGHGAGDICLKKVAHRLQKQLVREGDFIARYGGEEFVVILPEVDAAGAKQVAHKLLESVQNLLIPHAYSKVAKHITISIGCVTARITQKEDCTNLLLQADEMLYKAKENGRNQVCSQ